MSKEKICHDTYIKLLKKATRIIELINGCKELVHLDGCSAMITNFINDLKFHGLDKSKELGETTQSLFKQLGDQTRDIKKELYTSITIKRLDGDIVYNSVVKNIEKH